MGTGRVELSVWPAPSPGSLLRSAWKANTRTRTTRTPLRPRQRPFKDEGPASWPGSLLGQGVDRPPGLRPAALTLREKEGVICWTDLGSQVRGSDSSTNLGRQGRIPQNKGCEKLAPGKVMNRTGKKFPEQWRGGSQAGGRAAGMALGLWALRRLALPGSRYPTLAL